MAFRRSRSRTRTYRSRSRSTVSRRRSTVRYRRASRGRVRMARSRAPVVRLVIQNEPQGIAAPPGMVPKALGEAMAAAQRGPGKARF